jgi:hypothetical protein
MSYNGDLLDQYCEEEFDHTDWEMTTPRNGDIVVRFFKRPRPEYMADQQEAVMEEEDA